MFLKLFFSKVIDFSKQNWWIYLFLVATLFGVYITGSGSLFEVSVIFMATFLGNLFIMMMQDYYTSGKNKKGAINQIISVTIFTTVSVYGFLFKDQSQYIIWQAMYILAALNTFVFFVFKKELKVLNEYSFLFVNSILLFIFINYIQHEGFHILQAIGFSLITSGLVSINDKSRYWLNLIGIALLTVGSLIGFVLSYMSNDVDGIALGYFLLTATVFIFYMKLLPNYLKVKIKK